DDPKAVAKPLHRRAGDERASLERVYGTGADVPREGRKQAAVRTNGVRSRVCEEETSGPVRVFRLTRGEAGLTEERGLLIARHPRDRDRRAEVLGVRRPETSARRADRGEHRPRDVQRGQQLVVPGTTANIEYERPRGVGDV